MPPKWASIPSDPILYPYHVPIREPREYTFRLQRTSSCFCAPGDGGRTFFDPTSPIILRNCKLYALATVFEVQVELQRCSRCPPNRRRYIGPDLRELGIFNYNNSILVTHELLDYYTSCYTTSETPFSAWVIQTARVYANVDATFMGQDLFRAVWFSYAYIQHFEGDMVCEDCKEYPDTTIFDGITLAFGKKHLQDTLRPPTATHPESLTRPGVRYYPAQQLLLDKKLRSQVRSALDGPPIANLMAATGSPTPSRPATPMSPASNLSSAPTHASSNPASAGPAFPFVIPSSATPSTPTRARSGQGFGPVASPTTPSCTPSKAIRRQVALVEQHLDLLKSTSEKLRSECRAAATLFDHFLGPSAYAKGRRCPTVWRSFFKQIAAEESVVQLVNWTAWKGLVSFLQDGSANRSSLLSVPILFRLYNDPSCTKAALREIIAWIERRTREVFRHLMVDPQVLPDATAASLTVADDWRKVNKIFFLSSLVN